MTVESGSFVIDMNSISGTDLEAGKGKADLEGHLKNEDFFDVTKFPTAKFVITSSEIKEGKLPAFKSLPIFNTKIGIDQNPLNLKINDNALWLKSLIWSDLDERFSKISNAIEIAIQSDIDIVKAKTIEDFEKIFLDKDGIPKVQLTYKVKNKDTGDNAAAYISSTTDMGLDDYMKTVKKDLLYYLFFNNEGELITQKFGLPKAD